MVLSQSFFLINQVGSHCREKVVKFNSAAEEAFEYRTFAIMLVSDFSFRVVYRMDIVPHSPGCAKDNLNGSLPKDASKPCDPRQLDKSYHHGLEIWYVTCSLLCFYSTFKLSMYHFDVFNVFVQQCVQTYIASQVLDKIWLEYHIFITLCFITKK